MMLFLSSVESLLWPDDCPGCEAAQRPASPLGLCAVCTGRLAAGLQVVPLPPSIVRGWVLGPYSGPLGGVVRRAKFASDPRLASALGLRVGQAICGRVVVDAVVPVPMSLRRRMSRGFDQAERMAREVARVLEVPMRRSLHRLPGTPQVGRSGRARRRLGPSAFRVRGPVPERVLLVDDVVTTGASAHACARALRRAGTQAVWVAAATSQPQSKDS